MSKMGLGNIQNFEGVEPYTEPIAQYATLVEKSKGKDTTIGHWEIAGFIKDEPFKTYYEGFPQELLDEVAKVLKRRFNSFLNVYKSQPFFLEHYIGNWKNCQEIRCLFFLLAL